MCDIMSTIFISVGNSLCAARGLTFIHQQWVILEEIFLEMLLFVWEEVSHSLSLMHVSLREASLYLSHTHTHTHR